ncbi:MAG: L-2-amino-thiazoline-4-carboxylic acid hydrolase [Oscillospiraceae bacterium]|jgi:hypothetical protein|nr:L-2-amino-thiazoline-4-carboxylic acid hydrolase [Oscillospiraceae bacterium]
MITNEPRITFSLIQTIRGQLEQRALWLYLLMDEARKVGADPSEWARAAIRRCGLYQGGEIRAKSPSDSLMHLRRKLFTKGAQWIFEMDVKASTEDALDVDFHYCPLVKAWQKIGCSEEEIATLCETAMCGDAGIAESFGAHLDLGTVIAKGGDVCQIRFRR